MKGAAYLDQPINTLYMLSTTCALGDLLCRSADPISFETTYAGYSCSLVDDSSSSVCVCPTPSGIVNSKFELGAERGIGTLVWLKTQISNFPLLDNSAAVAVIPCSSNPAPSFSIGVSKSLFG